MSRIPVTVIIPTFNEAANIRRALISVLDWAEQVFIVDSYSTDDTIDVARSVDNERVQIVQHRFENYSAQWTWALTRLPIAQPWVMKLDADERATPEFRAEVSRVLAADDAAVAYIVHWRLIFMGQSLRWGGLFPNGNVRIWRHGQAHFENRDVNEHLVVDGPIGTIRNPIEHHDYKSLSHWLDRHNRYASMEAKSVSEGNVTGGLKPRLLGRPDERRIWCRILYYRLPFRPLIYFVYRYFLRLGFLDGKAGFRFTFLHAAYLYWIDLKRIEYASTGVAPEVIWPQRGVAHPAIMNSSLQRQVDREPHQEDSIGERIRRTA